MADIHAGNRDVIAQGFFVYVYVYVCCGESLPDLHKNLTKQRKQPVDGWFLSLIAIIENKPPATSCMQQGRIAPPKNPILD